MARSKVNPRRFLRAAEKRLSEARFLFDSGYHTAAVYLAGYAVECSLKAVILSSEPMARRAATLKSFRGAKAHEFMWLLDEMRERKNVPTGDVRPSLLKINWWSTEIRYDPSDMEKETAKEFVGKAEAIVTWAQGRVL